MSAGSDTTIIEVKYVDTHGVMKTISIPVEYHKTSAGIDVVMTTVLDDLNGMVDNDPRVSFGLVKTAIDDGATDINIRIKQN